MLDYKIWLGYIATIISVSSYLLYFHSLYKGKTKPHAFTFLVWATLNIIGFAAVLLSGGGTGAWVLAVNVIGCSAIAVIGFYQGSVKFDLYDWLALAGAMIGAALWRLTDNPLYAVIFISLSDSIGFIPSFRKSYRLPFEENLTAFAIGVPYYILAILALDSFTLTTSLYHIVIVTIDALYVVMIFIRRQQIKTPH